MPHAPNPNLIPPIESFTSDRQEVEMTRRRTPILALLFLILAAAALTAAPSARWAGTVAAVSGDDLSLVGVADHFRLAGSAIESQS